MNKESVEIACEAVAARGEKVTGSSVRAELGQMFAVESGGRPFGSPNTVLNYMNAWKDAKRQQSYQKQRDEEATENSTEAASDADTCELNTEIADAISRLSSLIATTNNATIRAERADAANRIEAVRVSAARDIAGVRATADDKIFEINERANQRVEDARSAEIDATNQVEQLEIRVQQLTDENTVVRELLDKLHEELKAACEYAATAIRQRDSLISEVKRLKFFELETAALKMKADDLTIKLSEAEQSRETLSNAARELAVANATITQISEQRHADLFHANQKILSLENKIDESAFAADEAREAHKLEIVTVRAETRSTIGLLQSAIAAMHSAKVS